MNEEIFVTIQPKTGFYPLSNGRGITFHAYTILCMEK
jgi:hypothetical protein